MKETQHSLLSSRPEGPTDLRTPSHAAGFADDLTKRLHANQLKCHAYNNIRAQFNSYLGAFAKLRKSAVSFVMSVRLSVRTEQFGSHWTDLHEI